jgi:23S rRNA (cytosine1962-C5)-methyltransferase
MLQVRVKQGVEKKLKNHYPWVYRKEILSFSRSPKKGETVIVRDYQGRFLGYGYINPETTIMIRLLSFKKEVKPSPDLIRNRIIKAYQYRQQLNLNSNAYRLVHSEGDFLPGLIVDVYDKWLAVEFTTYGMEEYKEVVIDTLIDLLKPEGIYEKVSEYSKKVEGLRAEEQLLYGNVPEEIIVKEYDLNFFVNIPKGQKTGMFLDQRNARYFLRRWIKGGERVLDVFCHSGGFAISAKKAGAKEVIGVDISPLALELARKNAELNNLEGIEWIEANAFDFLREQHKKGEKYDVVIIDPPSFAKNKASVENALRGYKELLVRGLHITKPGGLLAIFSCSFHITEEHLIKTLWEASYDTRSVVRVVAKTFQDLDHPWILQVPNSLYLKGLWVTKFPQESLGSF